MAFKKGESGNKNGRPKGALSKKTLHKMSKAKNLKEILHNWFNENLEDMLFELANWDCKRGGFHAKMDVMTKLLSYVLPTMKATEQRIHIDKMSDEEINEVFMRVVEGSDTNLKAVK